MDKLLITHSSGAMAEIMDYGAHLLSWKVPTGRDWIFLSKEARFEQGKAIRGGVPIIFPQFNAFGPGPRHGFARNSCWIPYPVTKTNERKFSLASDQETFQHWPFHFSAEYTVALEANALRLQLSVKNEDNKPFEFTAALHTYLAINALAQTTVKGLQGLSFWDNNGHDFRHRKVADSNILQLKDAIDRVYFQVTQALVLDDGKDQLKVSMHGFEDAVVWNPGREAGSAMSDMGATEQDRMLCIEAARIDQPVKLAPRETWSGAQILEAAEH